MPGRLVAQAQSYEIPGTGVQGSYQGVTLQEEYNERSWKDNGRIELSEEDAEGDEEPVEEHDHDGDVLQLKRPNGTLEAKDNGEDGENDDDGEAVLSTQAGSSNDEAVESGEESSVAENEWQGESDAEETAEEKVVDGNTCVFCGQDEEHDPGEDFEEYLACAVCGDNSHRHCARTGGSLVPDQDAKEWRCFTCVENGLEPAQNKPSPSRRRSSVPKIARDLLPARRGARPDSYSIFDQLIVDENPEGGSRVLRKRKASDEDDEPHKAESRRKRHKSQTSAASNAHVEAFNNGSLSIDADIDPKLESTLEGDEVVIPEQQSPRIRSSRSGRLRQVEKPLTRILRSDSASIVIAFSLDPIKVAKILSLRPKKRDRKRDRTRRETAPPVDVPHYPAIQPANRMPFYHLPDRESDDLKSKPYGGILTEAEADTSRTFPQAADRRRFEDARQRAEEDWKQKMANVAAATENIRVSQKLSGAPSRIKCINFGGFEIDTWHAAPYPEEYSRNKVLYICEFCLKYMSSDYVAWRHKLKCPAKHPPGDEIYRDGNLSFFEVDGRKNPVYCQNLCLLAKLFLGSKTLYYDVEPFLFYLMTEYDEYGYHLVGYFSKEKRPSSQNNVSCILVLPIHQRRGFGQLLIDFSYLLTRVEKKTGSPEKPLSDMGLVSYRSYWRLVLCYHLCNQTEPISISTISERTGMTPDDIISALEGLRALVRDPVTKTYALRLDYPYFEEYILNHERKGYVKLNPDALVWTPYVMGRNSHAQYEDFPPLQTMAAREAEDEGLPQLVPEEGVQIANMDADATIQINGALDQDSNPSGHGVLLVGDDDDANTPTTTPGPSQPNPSSTTDPRRSRSRPRSQSRGIPYTTPAPNGVPPPPSPIPPTRFEVFPPIPGTAARRRNFRPSRGGNRRTTTPVRRGGKAFATPSLPQSVSSAAVGTVQVVVNVRRTRSNLAESASIADVLADGDVGTRDGGDEGDEEGGEERGEGDGAEEDGPLEENEVGLDDDVGMEDG